MHNLLDTQHAQHTEHSNYIIVDMDGAPFIFWQVVFQFGPPNRSTRSDTAETDGSSDNQETASEKKRTQHRQQGERQQQRSRDERKQGDTQQQDQQVRDS